MDLNKLQALPLDTLMRIVHENAIQKGFHEQHRNNNDDFLNYQLMNLIREITELHEAWRNGNFNDKCDKALKMEEQGLPILTCAEEEYADVIIRTLDQCARLGIDIGRAVAAKHAYNTTRPYMHGNKNS